MLAARKKELSSGSGDNIESGSVEKNKDRQLGKTVGARENPWRFVDAGRWGKLEPKSRKETAIYNPQHRTNKAELKKEKGYGPRIKGQSTMGEGGQLEGISIRLGLWKKKQNPAS